VFQHGARNAFALGTLMGGKAAITNMPAIATLIGADVISAKDVACPLGNKSGMRAATPKRQRIRL
jgi:hypothetical protein